MSEKVRILIVEPSAIIRCGLVGLLEDFTETNVVVAQSEELLTLSNRKSFETPNILIVNCSYLGLFSPSQLRADVGNERLKVVGLQSTLVDQSILSLYDEHISITDSPEAIKSKISGLIDKSKESSVEGKKELSQREKEIIVCVVKGMTNREIADSLFLSTHTVIAHRRNIAHKLQIHSPAGLTIYAIVNKLVDLADIQTTL